MSLKSFTCDLTRLHRVTVSNLIWASVKIHRSLVAVSVGSKSSASSARNLIVKSKASVVLVILIV